MRWLVVLVLWSSVARAERHVVERGETLDHVAAAHGCTVEAIERANKLTTSLVRHGTSLVIPNCSRSQPRAARHTATTDDDAKARQALAVIDGATWTTTNASIGEPWQGRLDHAEHLDAGDGYVVRRPERAYGAGHVVEYLRHAIAEVRALYPDVHTLAIGDLSAEHGGKISDHRSHQSGLDVDVGFYFTRVPAGYPDSFAPADARLDLEATWALLVAFARTAERDDGVAIIFLDYGVQKLLYDWAKRRGTRDDELEFLLQYPHGSDVMTGLVRHWPGHANHFHVRFKR